MTDLSARTGSESGAAQTAECFEHAVSLPDPSGRINGSGSCRPAAATEEAGQDSQTPEPKKLKLTVMHNYGLTRADETTAAERVLGTPFPDLFEWLVEQMGELPLARKGKRRAIRNPLNLNPVPA